jgi:predicted nucleic acid-binding protein
MAVEPIYWDSNAYLGWLQAEAGKVDLCAGTLQRAEGGEVVIHTSALTIAEVLWLRGAPAIPQQKAEIVRKFFRRSHMRVRNVTRHIAEAAQDLVWNHSIKPKDAIHVATALDAGVIALETFDDGLLSKTNTVGNPFLIIRKPMAPAQTRLDL